MVAGFLALLERMGGPRRVKRSDGIGRWWEGLLDVGAGLALGLALFHDTDPTFDSVFFATGTAVAASHAPLTVAAFVVALGATLVAAASGLLGAAGRVLWLAAVPYAIGFLGAAGTLAMGILLATGGYEAFGRMLGLHP